MSTELPIYVSSTENSPVSTPATSRVPSPLPAEWIHDPEILDPNPLPFQGKIDEWIASTNPHPTSEEVRIFINHVGLLFHHSLTESREMTNSWHDERLEVRVLSGQR